MSEVLSASQLKTYRRCPRRWHYDYVWNLRSQGDTGEGAALGTQIHLEMEAWLKEGKLPTLKQACALLPFTPAPGTCTAEQKISFNTADTVWRGAIDVLAPGSEPMTVTILDHKSTSDLRYAKSEEELREDEQANLYAYWAYLEGYDFVDGQWNYVQTRGVPTVLPIKFRFNREQVVDVVAGCNQDGAEMQRLYQLGKKAELDIPQDTRDCYAYKKECPHKERCNPPAKKKSLVLRRDCMTDTEFTNHIVNVTGAKAPPPPPPRKAPPPPPTKPNDVAANAAAAAAAFKAQFSAAELQERQEYFVEEEIKWADANGFEYTRVEPEKGYINPPDGLTQVAATPEDANRIQGIVQPEPEVAVTDELDGLELHQLKALAASMGIPLTPKARSKTVIAAIREKRASITTEDGAPIVWGSNIVGSAPVVAQSGFKAALLEMPPALEAAIEALPELQAELDDIAAEFRSIPTQGQVETVLRYLKSLASECGCRISLTFGPDV